MLYFSISAVVCVLRAMDAHGPVWMWIASVGVALGSLLLIGGFYALGRPGARIYFGAVPVSAKEQIRLEG
jgi:hypothetical protein